METSLIPRPFSPTDAKRRAEENAREAERRSSARNASSSTIGAGGTLDLLGDINVSAGGTVRVIGQGVTDAGVPYEVYSKVGTYENVGGAGTYLSPGIEFGSGIFGNSAGARIYTRSGNDIFISGTTGDNSTNLSIGGSFNAGVQPQAGPTATNLNVRVDGVDLGYTNSDSVSEARFKIDSSSDPAGVLNIGHFTWRATLFARLRTKLGGKLWLESNSAAGASAIVMDGAGNIDLQTTGALTQNGAPISGGSGAVSSVAGKTGAVTLVKADVGLSNVDNTADTAKPISTATQTALDAKGPRILKHWERSGTTSTPDSTVWGPGIITADPNVSTDTGLLTMISQDVAQIRDTGTYAISVGMRFPSGVTATNSRSAISVEP
ncbi:hypothetical protein, partial [Arthrobacter phoenicis]